MTPLNITTDIMLTAQACGGFASPRGVASSVVHFPELSADTRVYRFIRIINSSGGKYHSYKMSVNSENRGSYVRVNAKGPIRSVVIR